MKIAFFTGAGISANAGIPVYRDKGSSWTDSDLEKKSHSSRYGNHLDELWDRHWGPLASKMKSAEPTRAHRAIADFDADEKLVITQNIDDLHERAGSADVAHLHGTMRVKCMRCKSDLVTEWTKGAPRCINCGSHKTRPDVVLFGEMLNRKLHDRCAKFILDADVLVVVGSSLNVQPAAGMVMDAIGRTRTIVINKDETKFWKFIPERHMADADKVLEDILKGL